MSPIDWLLLYLALGAALFVTDVAFSSRADVEDLMRAVRRADPLEAALALTFAVLVVLVEWSVFWPRMVAARLRRRR